MRIIKPTVIIEDDLGQIQPNGLTLAQHMAKKIEMAARKCYKSEGRMTEESYKTFLPGIFQTKRHTGIAEHRQISVTFVTDRGVSHEGVRHRMAAYLMESTRYCDYGDCQTCNGAGVIPTLGCMVGAPPDPCPKCKGKTKGVTYILPPWVNPCPTAEDQVGRYTWADFKNSLRANEDAYNLWRFKGWPPEQARGFLAHFVKTEYFASLNLGSWHNFLTKRTDPAAHPQMRQLAIPLLRYFRQHLPMFFDSVPYQFHPSTTGWYPGTADTDPWQFMHKGVWYPEAKLIVNPYYDQVPVDEVYSD